MLFGQDQLVVTRDSEAVLLPGMDDNQLLIVLEQFLLVMLLRRDIIQPAFCTEFKAGL